MRLISAPDRFLRNCYKIERFIELPDDHRKMINVRWNRDDCLLGNGILFRIVSFANPELDLRAQIRIIWILRTENIGLGKVMFLLSLGKIPETIAG